MVPIEAGKERDGADERKSMNENVKGRILSCVGGLYECRLPGGERVGCRAGGRFRYRGTRPLPGDHVILEKDFSGAYLLTEIVKRKNSLLRPPMANLTGLCVIASASMPGTLPLNLDKLLAIAEYKEIPAAVVITKCDLDGENAAELAKIYQTAGYPVFLTSALQKKGVDGLREQLLKRGKGDGIEGGGLIAFAGASGSGKSTLLNTLFPSLSLDTGELSRKIERGRNTTRAITLFPFSELTGEKGAAGYLADTPGFTLLDFVNFDFFPLEALPDTFREFQPYLSRCRYTDCTHTKEEECAVLAAVKEGKIPKSRHESFLSLYGDLKGKKAWETKSREKETGSGKAT